MGKLFNSLKIEKTFSSMTLNSETIQKKIDTYNYMKYWWKQYKRNQNTNDVWKNNLHSVYNIAKYVFLNFK